MGATGITPDAACGHWGPSRMTTNLLRTTASSSMNDDVSLKEESRSESSFEGIVGRSSALRQVLELVETVAPSDSTVLLLGETGTGKELIARALHDRSRRRQQTLVKLNCAAIPSGLLESELFGHERGAFTGAISQKIGRLELADHGTLFLDEVGDIPLELQPKLLRVLQEREFERLGSTRTTKVNVRLVAATHRDLDRMMSENRFRSDLYYRLNVFPIRIPPLRERREDIPLLVRHFAEKYARRMGKRIENIPAAAIRKLMCWHWPGNVRELENLVERAVILTHSNRLAISLPQRTNSGATAAPARVGNFDEQDRTLRILRNLLEHATIPTSGDMLSASTPEVTNSDATDALQRLGNFDEQDTIVRILEEAKGRVGGANGAAARLGLKRTTLIARMKKLGIDARKVLDAYRHGDVSSLEHSARPLAFDLRAVGGGAPRR
jgi:formate hydrogenlyase transcriptional activator